jgi:hypothetical protein
MGDVKKLHVLAALLLFHFGPPAAASACDLGEPKEAVILTVEGQIKGCGGGLETRFDLAMLEALPKSEVKTENPWEVGLVSYEGVALGDLLAALGANGTVLTFSALNDYRADITVADAQATGAVLAYRRNGELMTVRSKGPLFVVFPFTSNPLLQTEERYAQSVWQVTRITLK